MVVLVALGGAAGTVLRWWIGKLAPVDVGGIPWTTLGINIAGSFALGYLARTLSVAQAAPATIAAVTVGVCGGRAAQLHGRSANLGAHGAESVQHR